MKCREAQSWLLTLRTDQSLPGAVQQHLGLCARCRELSARLTRLDESVRQLPLPPGNPAARAGLWDRIEDSTLRQPIRPRRPSRWLLWRQAALTVAAAAAILFAIGVLVGALGWFTSPDPPQLAKQELDAAGGETALVVRLAKYDAQLGKTTEVAQQLDVLGHVAGDLKDEALRRVRQGTATDVPLLSELYGQVVREGIARRAVLLPQEKKPALTTTLVKQLRDTATEVRTLARQSLPVVQDMLQPLTRAAREAANLVESGRTPAGAAPPDVPGPRPLVATLVRQGLRLSAETDPVRRADLCSELASVLAPNVVLLSESGTSGQASELGTCMTELLNQGVAENLKHVQGNNLTAERQAEMERVRRHLTEAADVLKRNLSRASPEAKVELQTAIDAFGLGLDRVAEKIKDKTGEHPTPSPRRGTEKGDDTNGPSSGKQSFRFPDLPSEKHSGNGRERLALWTARHSHRSRATTLKWWVGDWLEDYVTTRLTAVKASHHFRVVGLVGWVERSATHLASNQGGLLCAPPTLPPRPRPTIANRSNIF
jgi:hypothetical protein